MSDLATLARPYAKSAFEFAKSKQSLPAWSKVLRTLGAVVSNEKVSKHLAQPQWSADQRADFLSGLCSEVMDAHTKNFLRVVSHNKRLVLLPEISKAFEHLKAASENRIEVSVSSAIALNEEYKTALSKTLSAKLKHELEVSFHVDESLMGGAVIRYGDVVIDASVKNKLSRLKVELQQ